MCELRAIGGGLGRTGGTCNATATAAGPADGAVQAPSRCSIDSTAADSTAVRAEVGAWKSVRRSDQAGID